MQCRCGAVPSPLQALAAWLAPDSPLSSEPGKRGVCAIYVMPGEGPHPSTCRGHLSRSHLDPQAGTAALIPWVSHASPAQCQSPGDTHQPPILGRRTDGWSSTLGTPLWKEPLISRSLVGGPGAPEVLASITWGTQGIVVQQGLCDEPRTPGPWWHNPPPEGFWWCVKALASWWNGVYSVPPLPSDPRPQMPSPWEMPGKVAHSSQRQFGLFISLEE